MWVNGLVPYDAHRLGVLDVLKKSKLQEEPVFWFGGSE